MNAWTGGFDRAGIDGFSLTDRFAEQLSLHVDEADLRAGMGTDLDPGGDVAASAAAARVPPGMADAMFQRMCRRLGAQAA